MPTLKSSADTGVRNVPWYLMSGSILASFSLAFWRIRAADSWCEILAVSHSLMTVAHETAQVKIIQKKIITFVSNNSYLTGMKQIKLSVSIHRASKDFVENHQQLSSVWIRGFFFFFNWLKTSFLLVWWLKNSVEALALQALRLCLCQYLGWAHSWL